MCVQLHRSRSSYIITALCTAVTRFWPPIALVASFFGNLETRWHWRQIFRRPRILMTVGEYTVAFRYFVWF